MTQQIMIRASLACTCGARWHGSLPESAWKAVLDQWQTTHSGDGHAKCTAREAGRLRAKAEGRYAYARRVNSTPTRE